MAHVGEEGGLRPVQLGERLRAAPLFIVGERVGNRGGHLAADEREEAAVAGVEQAVGIEPGDEDDGPAGLAGARDGEQRHPRRRLGPDAGREPAREIRAAHLDHLSRREGLAERPGTRLAQTDGGGRERTTGGHAGAARQVERLPAGVGQIDEREGQVARIGRQGFRAPETGLGDGARVGGAGRQLAEQHELALADDPPGVVGVRAEDAAGAALVVRHGAVGEGVVGLLRVAVPLHDQEQRLVVGALVAEHRRRGPGARPGPRSPARRPTRAAPARRGACRRGSSGRRRCRG